MRELNLDAPRKRPQSPILDTVRIPIAGRQVHCLVSDPPCWLQNPENKRSTLRLCARSLNLQDLHAKSSEPGGSGRRCAYRPILKLASWENRLDLQRSFIIFEIMK